jgi:hypothetical protein
MRRSILSAAAPACLLIGFTPVAASANPAPTGNATATAAQVSSLVSVSSTGAQADPSKAEARAAVISIGGHPALGTGGSQAGEGESGAALFDTGDKLPAKLQVAPWKANARGTASAGKRTSHASAALARVEVPSVAKLGVLTSDAQAEHVTEKSSGTSTSDAADLTLLDTTRVVLLHSEVSSAGKGHSYLVGLSGNEIGTDEQLGRSPVCSLDAGVASLTCLTASGGVANGITSGAAEVAGVKTALGLNPVAAFATTATSGPGTPSILPSVGAAVPVETSRAAAAVAPAAPAPAQGTLPRTGVAIVSAAASALAALLSGLVLRLFGRRRRLAA